MPIIKFVDIELLDFGSLNSILRIPITTRYMNNNWIKRLQLVLTYTRSSQLRH